LIAGLKRNRLKQGIAILGRIPLMLLLKERWKTNVLRSSDEGKGLV